MLLQRIRSICIVGPILGALGALAACSGATETTPTPGTDPPPAPTTPPGTPAPTTPTPAPTTPTPTPTPTSGVDCKALVVDGDPRATAGAKWTYAATHDGTTYKLDGVLFTPQGTGPFPAVVISHGKGGAPTGYSSQVARTMVTWGLVAIATRYSHAITDDGLPKGAEGASPENVLRAIATRNLLGCLGSVDDKRVAAHGHSMGAFLTGELVGKHPKSFIVASHTAGGTNNGGLAATKPATAALITTPYQMHHGDIDTTVLIQYDRTLAQVLTDHGTTNELVEYPGYDHNDIPLDAGMLVKVKAWYTTHGVF
jgi:dienelactone hydrolase